jgi:nucleoid-associated protein YgaU
VAEALGAEEAGGAGAEIAAVAPEISKTAPDALAVPGGGPVAPGVDVVRVAPDGQALVAGTAAPGALVGIYADRDRIAEVQADQSGNFVAIFQAEPSAEAKTLTVEATAPDGLAIVSEDVVVLLPAAEAAVETPASAAQATSGEVAQAVAAKVEEEIAVDLVGMAEEAAVANAEPEDDQVLRVASTAIVRDGVAQVVPLARPAGVQARDITLASISYVDGGLVTLAGFGVAGADLRAYVDDAFSRAGEVGGGGRWAIELGEVAVGVHRIRIDQVGPDGKVASRVETPFKRDAPQPSEPVAEGQVRPVSVVVQPGSNLWTLARIHYGSGVLYTQIFKANSDLIREPELIYPGQVFELPEPGE